MAKPTITAQPLDQVVSGTGTANFSIAATSSGGALQYQWYDAETNGAFGGETSSSLSLPVGPAAPRFVFCVVMDDNGFTQSDTVHAVSDEADPILTEWPRSSTQIEPVQQPTFTADWLGAPTVQWYEGTTNLQQTGGNSYTPDASLVPDGNPRALRGFTLRLNTGNGGITDVGFAIAFNPEEGPTITAQPQDAVQVGTSLASMTVEWTGTAESVLWSYDSGGSADGNIGNVTTDLGAGTSTVNFYDITGAARDRAYNVYATITGSSGDTVTQPALLSYQPDAPTITQQPVAVSGVEGSSAALTAAATASSGDSIVRWQWFKDGELIPIGYSHLNTAQTATLQFPVLSLDDAGTYRAEVTDDGGVTSTEEVEVVVTADNMVALDPPPEWKISPWSIADGAIDTTFFTSRVVRWSIDSDVVDDYVCPIRTHRGLDEDGITYWIPFYDKSARCHRGPLINDAYNRYYWTQDGQNMRYSPLDELKLDSRTIGYDVGVPAPTQRPLLTIDKRNGTEDLTVDRAYVYTYVTLFGEEGPPSPATVRAGPDDTLWRVEGMETGPRDGLRRRVTHKRIYRSVSVNGSAEFHFVAQIPVHTESFNDIYGTDEVALNSTLESTTWFPPPDNLEGLIAHPNGFFVGFVDRTLCFSEPYRPHAWPPEYQLSTLGRIVALGVYGTTLVVATDSYPYTSTGIAPGAMTLSMHDTAEPCTSRYGVVSMPFGVFFPSPNGLVLASPRGFEVATQQLMTKQEWQSRYTLSAIDACWAENRYLAFYSPTRGFLFGPAEPLSALVDINVDDTEGEPDRQDSVFTDVYTGRTYLFDGCDMYEWNPISGEPLTYQWESKEFDTPEPVNFGAGRIIWYALYTPPDAETTARWREWNVARMAAAPLNPMNGSVLNGVNRQSLAGFDDVPENKQPFSDGPLYDLPPEGEAWPNTPRVVLDVIANETVVYSKDVTHTRTFRLPSGYRATRWRFRLRSNIHIQSVKVAETGKELAQV